MWKAFTLGLLLAATLVPSLSAASTDLCGQLVCVNGCDGGNICVVATQSGNWVCAGVGFGLQGVAACADPVDRCLLVSEGIDRTSVCIPTTLS